MVEAIAAPIPSLFEVLLILGERRQVLLLGLTNKDQK
jgi:hypothetical protein